MMSAKPKMMGATEAKSQFLKLLTVVEKQRKPIVITRNGKPVAQLAALDLPAEKDPLDVFVVPGGSIVGDITAPLYTDRDWRAFEDASLVLLK
jgi:antitoxin (DNA-binding transcriptional repressor) of toxin-antitoxin stability system